jgi:hypothetical protein
MQFNSQILKFCCKLFFIALPAVLIYAVFIIYNLHYDPFGVLHTDLKNQKLEPNQHFIKIRYLIENNEKYPKLLFGSSRAGNIRAELIGFYNMSYSEGVPKEHFADIKLLLQHNVNISNIIIALDNASYLVDPELHVSQLMRKPYQDGIDLYRNYLLYFFDRPSMVLHKEIVAHHNFYNDWSQLLTLGRPIHIGIDDFIDRNPEKHSNDEKFKVPYWPNFYCPRVSKSIAEIKEIIDLCKANNIDIKFFINPMHKITYLRQNLDEYFDFLKRLAKITDYFDFAGINKITSDNMNYYETSHFRVKIGDLMIQRMFFGAGDDSFGIHIDSNNIDKHIEYLKQQLSQNI